MPLSPILPFNSSHPFSKVFRLKMTLKEVKPAVWRRIEVPSTYSFWDLHIALTDAFGWWDSHLHEWNIKNPKSPKSGRKMRLGIWDEDDPAVKMDWEYKIAAFFRKRDNPRAIHKYDFGDGWKHLVELEDVHAREDGVAYPRCVDGARACPPDDCGGPSGYREVLEILSDPAHEEHEDRKDWLDGMKGLKGRDFDPERFSSAEVHFDDPYKRWHVAFNHHELTPDMRMYERFKGQDGG
jgi:hypothetical protein